MDEVESLKSCKSIGFVDSDSSDGNQRIATGGNSNNSTLTLLTVMSFLDSPIENFAHSSTIEPLIGYIQCTKSHRAMDILSRIIRYWCCSWKMKYLVGVRLTFTTKLLYLCLEHFWIHSEGRIFFYLQNWSCIVKVDWAALECDFKTFLFLGMEFIYCHW